MRAGQANTGQMLDKLFATGWMQGLQGLRWSNVVE